MLDLNDLIRHPEKYLVDGKPMLSAKLEMQTLDGSVFIHRYDYPILPRARLSRRRRWLGHLLNLFRKITNRKQ